MGTPDAASVSLRRLIDDGHEVVAVYTQPDRPSGRGNKITFSPVKQLAIESGIAVHQPIKIKTPEAIESFREHNADVAVVVAYGRILPAAYLEAFEFGAVNVHFSLLPRYRGAAPVNWAIVNGDTLTGVTTIRMDEGLDTGDIYLAEPTNIGENETAPELMERLSVLGAEVLAETLKNIGDVSPKPQDDLAATFAPIMKRDDGLIDWKMRADEIFNRLRGFQPFPGTHTTFRGKRMAIHWASPGISAASNPPGSIISVDPEGLVVACGSGTALLIKELQPEGKRRMSVRDFINGMQPKPGEVFGG